MQKNFVQLSSVRITRLERQVVLLVLFFFTLVPLNELGKSKERRFKRNVVGRGKIEKKN